MNGCLRGTVAAAALVLLAACGGGVPSSAAVAGLPSLATVAVEPTLPACVPANDRAQLPPELDGVFPLPPGTLITSAKLTGQGPLVVAGYIPMRLKDAAAYLQEQLPTAGLRPGEGDAELDEAEQSFSGHNLEGQWKVHSVLDCPDAVSLTIAVSLIGPAASE
jgi:hypothetical protein